jgi:phosphoglycerate kinase
MGIKRLEELPVDGRRVFLRLDLNVPMDEEGAITDDTRIQAALPTLQHLLEREARLVVASHLGKPKGVRLPNCSLEPVAARLADLLDVEIILSEDGVGDGPRKMAFALREGQIMMLENLRFYPGETQNDDSFAKQLSTLADMYVNDAFGCMHRSHASIVGVPRYLKDRGIGLLVEKEIQHLSRLKDKPTRPFVAVIGGARVKDKLELLSCLLGRVDTLCLGGSMALTFLAASGHKTGASRVELESLAGVERFLRRAASSGTEILLPVDHVVTEEVSSGAPSREVGVDAFPPTAHAVDIGAGTVQLFKSKLESARTIFWNGPMGVFEVPPFHKGTEQIGKAVARSNAYSLVGGGDSVSAVRRSGLAPFISHVSTGGGASIAFLEGKAMPGMSVLEEA